MTARLLAAIVAGSVFAAILALCAAAADGVDDTDQAGA